MSCQFQVGQKVVCVDDGMRVSWREGGGWFSRFRQWVKLGHNLNRGDVYTIADIQIFRDKLTDKEVVCLVVIEAWHFELRHVGFPHDQFRPVKTTSIEIFEKMLAPAPRVKQPV